VYNINNNKNKIMNNLNPLKNSNKLKTGLYISAVALLLGVSYLITSVAFQPQRTNNNNLASNQQTSQNQNQNEIEDKTTLAARAPIDINTETFLIPQTGITFSPNRENADEFGEQPLVIQAVDSRVTGNNATCTIQYRQYANPNNQNPTFTSNNLTAMNGTYNPTTGCSATLPASAQTFYLYEFRVLIDDRTGTNASGFQYEATQAYFFLFGAIGRVTIT
jgi:hypothetical protein